MPRFDEVLRRGIIVHDKAGRQILYRYLSSTDNIGAITDLLHEAYAPLAVAGLAFVASQQNAATTRERFGNGETVVAIHEGCVGVITLADVAATHGSPFYDRPDVASFGQFAVCPSHQGCGIGSRLLEFFERRATEKGVGYLALDTAESAIQLIDLYGAKGYRFVAHAQWTVTNYRSVILAKKLT